MRNLFSSTRRTVLALTFPLLASAASAAQAACSCTAMTVRHAGTMKICSNNELRNEFIRECTSKDGVADGCAGYTYAYTCVLGVNQGRVTRHSPWQRTGFGIDATLSGNFNECHSGHVLQETITGDQGVTKPQVHDLPSGDVTIGSFDVHIISNQSGAQDFPDVGATTTGRNGKPKFGADQYTNPNATDLLIEKNGGHIKWWDNPDQSKDGNAEAATWVFRYFSFVQGSSAANSCACVYDITVNWPSGGTATTAWAERQASSRNCHF
jgi:hypothetical protein